MVEKYEGSDEGEQTTPHITEMKQHILMHTHVTLTCWCWSIAV